MFSLTRALASLAHLFFSMSRQNQNLAVVVMALVTLVIAAWATKEVDTLGVSRKIWTLAVVIFDIAYLACVAIYWVIYGVILAIVLAAKVAYWIYQNAPEVHLMPVPQRAPLQF